jgi:excisionase family DNA binding protein
MAVKLRASPGKQVRLLTVRQAAEYLGTTPSTLYSKIWRREVPFIKWGRSVRFDIVDLDELIAKSKVAPQEVPALRDGFQRRK